MAASVAQTVTQPADGPDRRAHLGGDPSRLLALSGSGSFQPGPSQGDASGGLARPIGGLDPERARRQREEGGGGPPPDVSRVVETVPDLQELLGVSADPGRSSRHRLPQGEMPQHDSRVVASPPQAERVDIEETDDAAPLGEDL